MVTVNTKAESPVPTKSGINVPDLNFTFSADALIMGGVLIWALWDKVMKPQITEKLDGVFAPVQEERRLSAILAQVGLITGASRVVLAAFHNGALDNAGYHLQKLSTVNTYTAPGHEPMAVAIRDLPIGRIMFELEQMLKADDWVCVINNADLPQPCRDHLVRNSIHKMCNKLVKVGNLPIGILSVQYDEVAAQRDPDCCTRAFFKVPMEHEPLLEDLYQEIASVMRRRVIHPSKIHLFFRKLLGNRGHK